MGSAEFKIIDSEQLKQMQHSPAALFKIIDSEQLKQMWCAPRVTRRWWAVKPYNHIVAIHICIYFFYSFMYCVARLFICCALIHLLCAIRLLVYGLCLFGVRLCIDVLDKCIVIGIFLSILLFICGNK